MNIRFFTLLVYLDDTTFEIIEDRIQNSGKVENFKIIFSYAKVVIIIKS